MAIFSPQKNGPLFRGHYFVLVLLYTFSEGGTSILLFPRFPHKLSDGQLGLMLLVIIPVIFGLFWLYNAYRLGRLKWKPKGQANPRLVCLVILFIIIVSVVLLLVAE